MKDNVITYKFRSLALLVFLLAVSSGLGGCAVWDFVEVRYQNATGYFNTYYNAKSLYDEAMEEIDKNTAPQIEATPSQTNVPQNFGQSLGMSRVGRSAPGGMAPDGSPVAAMDMARTDVEGATQANPKGAEYGGVYGEDEGFDEPGAGFERGGYGASGMPQSRAEQLAVRRRMMKEFGMSSSVISKLDRVVEKCSRLLVHYPKSKWVDNSLLMIGVSFYYKSDLIKAERKFKELLEGFPESDLRPEAMMWLARVYDRMDHIEDAESLYLESINLAISQENADIVADAYYSLGEMYLTTGSEDKALQAYTEGAEYASSKSNRIRLELALAREHEYMGNLDKAQEAYANIIKLDPEMELLFKAELNYARISRVRGDIDEAINTLADMLDEPAYLEYDGPLQLEIGRLYEAADENEAAIEQYRYTDTTFQKTPVSSQACYSLAMLYENKFGDYDKAFEYYVKSKLAYPGIQEAQYASYRAKAFEPYFKVRRELNNLDTLLFFVLHPDSLAARDAKQAIKDSVEREKKIAEGWDPNEKSEEQRMIERLARRRPHGRNTGRINVWQQELDNLTGKPSNSSMVSGIPMKVNGGSNIPQSSMQAGLPLYRKLPLRAVSADSVLQALSTQRFEMGWVMFDDIGNLDSAIYYYNFAIEGTIPDSLEAQAYYTLSEIYRIQNDKEMMAHYQDLLVRDHPRSRYAKPILLARGMDIPKDSATVATEAYERAAKILERGSYEEGIKALRQMSKNYSYSEQAVRAQLAIAMTYETQEQGEKAIEVYRTMVDEHPGSPFSKRAHEVLGAIERAKNEPPEMEKVPKEEVKTREIPKVEPPKPQLTPEERFQAMRDSILTGKKKLKDPTEDKDFPLAIPGESKKDVETQPAPQNTPPQSVPGNQQNQPGAQNTSMQPAGVPVPGGTPKPATKDTSSQQSATPPQTTPPGTKPQ